MKSRLIILSFAISVLFAFSSCTVQWTKAIKYGHISQKSFYKTVKMEIQNGLIFVPVKIDGKEYRFLFDTGAPFSISEELQKQHAFKVVSRGNIVDSDHSKKRVDWVQVDAIQIGEISFLNQTAFLADFKANPKLECLGFDGIIGSNLMRHCNWTIDQKQKKLTLSSSIDKEVLKNSITIPFDQDVQYSMFISIDIGKAKVNHLLVDYGSNGSIALNKKAFSILKKNGIIDKTLVEKGAQQSGVIGEPVDINHEITVSDLVKLHNLKLNDVELKTGKSDLVGNEVMSRFKVTIDWDNKALYLLESEQDTKAHETFGFSIGYTNEKGVYIQSVIENSFASQKGIKPNMKVTKVDTLDFENGSSFCDFVRHNPGATIRLELIDSKAERREFTISKTKLRNNQ